MDHPSNGRAPRTTPRASIDKGDGGFRHQRRIGIDAKNYNERLSSCENVLPGIERFCTDEEIVRLSRDVMRVDAAVASEDLEGRLVAGDIFEVAKYLPSEFIDLLIPDPPYNLSRNFNGNPFMTKGKNEYQSWSGISSIC